MADLGNLVTLGQTLGYEGEELREFIKEERKRIHEERERAREEREAEERAFERNQRAIEREHERQVELKKLEIEAKKAEASGQNGGNGSLSLLRPKLSVYKDGEEIEPFIVKFERVATQYRMNEAEKAVQFMNCFEGKALAILARLGLDAKYEEMKDSLVKAYGLTTDGARKRFYDARLGDKETAAQFLVRLSGHLDRWIEKDETPDTKEGLRDLVLRAQLERSAPPELRAEFKLQGVKTAEEMVTIADAFFEAFGYDKRVKGERSSKGKDVNPSPSQQQENQPQSSEGGNSWCKNSNSYQSGGQSKGRNKWFGAPKPHTQGGYRQSQDWAKFGGRQQVTAAAESVKPLQDGKPDDDCSGFVQSDGPTVGVRQQISAAAVFAKPLQDGKSDVVSSDFVRSDEPKVGVRQQVTAAAVFAKPLQDGRSGKDRSGLVLSEGKVDGKPVQVMRDKGSNGCMVRKSLVRKEQYTGERILVWKVDNSRVTAPEAWVHVESPFYSGSVKAAVLPNPISDVVIGNIKGALDKVCSSASTQTGEPVTTRSVASTHGSYSRRHVTTSRRHRGRRLHSALSLTPEMLQSLNMVKAHYKRW